MKNFVWTPVGEDTGEVVLAVGLDDRIMVGYLVRRGEGWWICVNALDELRHVRAYIPIRFLVQWSKEDAHEPTPMYRPSRFEKHIKLSTLEDY